VAPDPKDPLNDVSTMNKIIEYMAMGKPVVVFDLKEARVSAGDAAIYATPNEPDDFARKIVELLEDPERRFYMGAIGRQRFHEKLAWEHQRDNLLRMYAGLFGESAKKEGLRILFLNHNVVRAGGTFFRALDAARHLVRRGHHVTLLSIDNTSRFRISTEVVDGVEIVHTPDLFWGLGRSGWDPWDVLVRLRYVMKRDWDVVHAWDCRPAVIFPSLAVRFLKNGKSAPLFIDWCDWWGRGGTQMERGGSWLRYVYNAVETFFEESFRRYADGSTVISRALFDRAVRLGVPSDKIRMLPQGCDEVTAPDISRADARKELGIDADAVLLISVGVLNIRDAALLFDAARLVRQELPKAQFCLIGKNRGRVPDDLANTVIHDLGFLPNEPLAHYLAAADAAVVSLADTLSSRSRWPSRLNMSMSRSTVIVTSRVGDLPVLLEREGAAFVSRPDARDLAANIVRAVTDTEAAERVRTAAKRVATDLLAWPSIIEDLEKFYLQVAAGRVSATQTA
jgi:glycosyltransferase involved in cell wall biosynthesis